MLPFQFEANGPFEMAQLKRVWKLRRVGEELRELGLEVADVAEALAVGRQAGVVGRVALRAAAARDTAVAKGAAGADHVGLVGRALPALCTRSRARSMVK